MTEERVGPVEALQRIALLLERAGEASFRARSFRRAARALAALPPGELVRRAESGTLTDVPGVGAVSAAIAGEALAGVTPRYLARLEREAETQPASPGAALFARLRGDCHVHSHWSDGVASIREMALAAAELGHEYVVLTDHSPSLQVARGLSPERLREQLREVAALNAELAPFRILTGIEVDIRADGTLDQDEALLASLDVVVGSLHSRLRAPEEEVTTRMLRAVENPHLDVLGHCTGRLRTRRRLRPESTFDAPRVFQACARLGKAVEINSLPSRRDPPRRLIELALELGCSFTLDSDAHAPEQLAWKAQGCERAVASGVPAERILNTLAAEDLLAWARSHEAPVRGTSEISSSA